jgi:hypothetical protein
VHSWAAAVPASALEAAFPTVGHLDAIAVTGRDGHGDWGGRVLTVTLVGHSANGRATSVVTTGARVMAAYSWPAHATGLRSNWWG